MSNSFWPHGLYSHAINQARILGWVAFPFYRGSSQPRNRIQVSHIAGRFFTSWATGEPKNTGMGSLSLLQWIFLTQESNQGLLHCRWILYYWAIREALSQDRMSPKVHIWSLVGRSTSAEMSLSFHRREEGPTALINLEEGEIQEMRNWGKDQDCVAAFVAIQSLSHVWLCNSIEGSTPGSSLSPRVF